MERRYPLLEGFGYTVCLVEPPRQRETSSMIGGLKGTAYLISAASVVMLGIVSCDGTLDKSMMRTLLNAGMTATVIGMAVRMISHIRDKKGARS